MDASPDAAGPGATAAVHDSPAVAYAELHCVSNFSFLRGASHPVELVERASALGYRALALTDECSVAGVVRAHMRAKELALPLVIGAEFTFTCGLKLVVLAATRPGYGQLCELITRGRRAAPKGSYRLTRADLADCIAPSGDCLLLWRPANPEPANPEPTRPVADSEPGCWLAAHYPGVVWLGVSVLREGTDAARVRDSIALAAQLGIGCVACGDVHMHAADRRPLQDALTAIRHGVPLREAGQRLFANGQRHLREPGELARLHPQELLQESARIAARCRFSLDELRYEYPREIVPPGETPASYLRRLTEEGAAGRWPQGVPPRANAARTRTGVIAELGYESIFPDQI
jgi:error-prone DNA polymerase